LLELPYIARLSRLKAAGLFNIGRDLSFRVWNW